ncbi:MAG: alkaline phosphatase family protein [Bacteroidota bacterium]
MKKRKLNQSSYKIPQFGSLGLLALGDKGLKAWRHFKETGQTLNLSAQAPNSKKGKRKLLIVGWDAADWKIISPLMERGLMPSLQSIVEQGVMGNLRTLDPPFSPMLWTSIATGKNADQHGILNFVEPNPESGDIRPVQSTSRKCRAFWNILSHLGYKVNVVGWWPSHPAEPINGVMVSNRFHKFKNNPNLGAIAPEAVYPSAYLEKIASLKIDPSEITAAHVAPFVPNFHLVDQEKDQSLNYIRWQLAESATTQAVTTYLMEHTEWDVTAVYFEAIDRLCHRFMKFHPPRQAHIPEEFYNLYKKVVQGAYRFSDMMLGSLLDMVDEHTTVMVLSDHGFHSDHLRLAKIPKEPAGIAHEHRPMGVFCMRGKDVRKDELIFGAGLLDITPTILASLGEAIGKDMEGKVLQQCFEHPKSLQYLDSWEAVEGEFGEHPEHLRDDPTTTKEVLQQLIDLGYLEKMEDTKEERLEKVTKETQYNLSKVYASKKQFSKALEILEQLYEEDLVDRRYNRDLITYYCVLGETEKARAVFTNFKKYSMGLKKADFDRIEGQILFAEKRYKDAVSFLDELLEKSPKNPTLNRLQASAFRELKQFEQAAQNYQILLANDPDDAHAWLNLGVCHFKQEKYEEAAADLLKSIQLDFNTPEAHFELGRSLMRLGMYEDATNALETALKLRPDYNRARHNLIKIYQDHFPQPDKATAHLQQYYNYSKSEMVIVCGLPRSGTSMLMQMLAAGGMPVLMDNARPAYEHNPKGYYEYEAVKQTKKDRAWMDKAAGKAVKVTVPILPHLSLKRRAKVLFIEREITEVLLSQDKMLGKAPATEATYNWSLAQAFEKLIKKAKHRLNDRTNFATLYLKYDEIVQHPQKAAEAIVNFLDSPLDTQAMARAVDRDLYRNRTQTSSHNKN